MEPILITMDTNPNEGSFRFINTLIKNKWKFRLIGTDTTWTSFFDKIILYTTELKHISETNPDQICVISDCRDVLCVRSPLRFLEIFNEFNSNIVVSGEMVCGGSTDPKFWDPNDKRQYNCVPLFEYWKSKGFNLEDLPNRKYVNSGLIAGKAIDLLKMYEWQLHKGKESKITDDQVLMGIFMNENPIGIEIDIDAKLLHTSVFGPTCGYLNSFQPKDAPTFAEIMGRSAFFLHIPGAGMQLGNQVIYEMASLLIDHGYNNDKLLEMYKISEENIPLNWFKEGI